MFSEKIFELRKKKGITQRELAEAVGITASSISAYEKGSKIPPLDTAVEIAKHLGVSLDYLCGLQDRDNAGVRGNLTRADVLRMLSAIRENASSITVNCTENYNRLSGSSSFETSIVIYSNTDWANKYFEKLDTLAELCKSGDIDAEVLEAWKEKKLSEATYQTPINLPEDVPCVSVDDEELPF